MTRKILNGLKRLNSLNRLFVFLFTCMIAQSSYSQQKMTIKEMEDSMALGNLNVQVDLAIEYISGERVEVDYTKAYSMIRDAAEKGNRYGQLMLGVCYEAGISVEKNQDESFRWFMRSAEQGNISAMERVGQAYEYGYGVAADLKKAVAYYQKSAEGGYPVAQLNMGILYEHGHGVEQDIKKAFEWVSLAAQQHEGARFILAKYYFNGWGTEQNKAEALRLLNSLKDNKELGEAASYYSDIIERGDTMQTYEFQFRWIPRILFDWKKGEYDDTMLTDITEWKLYLGGMFISHYEWDWAEVSAQVYPQPNDIDIIVYRMPEPQRPPLCKYAAAVIDRKQRTVQYFTLELSIDVSGRSSDKPWMFCGVSSDMSHLNFGWFKDTVTEHNFVEYVKKYVEKEKKTERADQKKKDKKKKKIKRPEAEIIQATNDSICAEGYNLYIAETINWMSTDSVLAHYSRDDLGENLIWQPTDSTWSATFFDKDIKNCVFELKYNHVNRTNTISYEKRPITETERAQARIKNIMIKNAFENYGSEIKYNEKCGNPNFDFVRINDNLIRLYILQGTVQPNTIPFGNDYSIDFDNNGNALCFRKYHNSLIAIKTVDVEGQQIKSVVHSHLRDNPYITPTDVCNFLLYRGGLKENHILSTALDGYIIYHAEDNSTEFVPMDEM